VNAVTANHICEVRASTTSVYQAASLSLPRSCWISGTTTPRRGATGLKALLASNFVTESCPSDHLCCSARSQVPSSVWATGTLCWEPLTAITRLDIFNRLSTALLLAVKRHYIEFNPCDTVGRPEAGEIRRKPAPRAESIARLLRQIEQEPLGAAVVIALTAGLRQPIRGMDNLGRPGLSPPTEALSGSLHLAVWAGWDL